MFHCECCVICFCSTVSHGAAPALFRLVPSWPGKDSGWRNVHWADEAEHCFIIPWRVASACADIASIKTHEEGIWCLDRWGNLSSSMMILPKVCWGFGIRAPRLRCCFGSMWHFSVTAIHCPLTVNTTAWKDTQRRFCCWNVLCEYRYFNNSFSKRV